MPLLKIHTNQTLDPNKQTELLSAASTEVANLLGKSEKYVMVILEAQQPLLFGGTTEPAAYLELKSLGLPQEQTATLSSGLCHLIQQQLDIPGERIYIEFSDAARHMWGWNGGTF